MTSNDEEAIVRVQDVPERARYEVTVDGVLAGFAEYRLREGVITFTHTQIEDAFGGRGLGTTLVRAVLDDTRTRTLQVVPVCPFFKRFLERHAEYADVTAAR